MKAFISIFLLFAGCSMSDPKYPLSDHYDGEKFHNPGKNDDLKSFFTVLKWKLTSDVDEFPEKVAIKNYPFRPLSPLEKVNATFINHATFLIQLPGMNVLTDPIYSKRASPFSFLGPKRVKEPGLPFDVLPKIDVVVVSHNHYDHLDIETLKRLDEKFHPLFLVALGDEELLRKNDIQNVKPMDWWQEVKIKDVKFIFTPAQHWSARHLWDKNEALWGSWMIDNGIQKIYHGGDSGYSGHFRDIKSRLGIPDLALLPIGAYEPRWFMKHHHMNPAEAVQAHIDLGATRSIGMHFGTFQLTDEGIKQPELDLKKAKADSKISDDQFLVLEQGQSISY